MVIAHMLVPDFAPHSPLSHDTDVRANLVLCRQTFPSYGNSATVATVFARAWNTRHLRGRGEELKRGRTLDFRLLLLLLLQLPAEIRLQWAYQRSLAWPRAAAFPLHWTTLFRHVRFVFSLFSLLLFFFSCFPYYDEKCGKRRNLTGQLPKYILKLETVLPDAKPKFQGIFSACVYGRHTDILFLGSMENGIRSSASDPCMYVHVCM